MQPVPMLCPLKTFQNHPAPCHPSGQTGPIPRPFCSTSTLIEFGPSQQTTNQLNRAQLHDRLREDASRPTRIFRPEFSALAPTPLRHSRGSTVPRNGTSVDLTPFRQWDPAPAQSGLRHEAARHGRAGSNSAREGLLSSRLQKQPAGNREERFGSRRLRPRWPPHLPHPERTRTAGDAPA